MHNFRQQGIHETAIIHPEARIAGDVEIGPYSVVNGDVTIGSGTVIGAYVYIEGRTTIGQNNIIKNGVSLGQPPQDKGYQGEDTALEIGDNNLIREYASIHRGTNQGSGVTRIGDNNYLMAYSHVAYNCRLGKGITLASTANLAGNVVVEDMAYISSLVGIHQQVRVGRLAYVGSHSKLVKDLPPFLRASGQPARARGLHYRGLRREGLPLDFQKRLEQAYDLLYNSGYNLSHALEEIEDRLKIDQYLDYFVDFLRQSQRGICTGGQRERGGRNK